MRRVAATAAAAVLAAGVGLLVNPSPADAHGATVFPGSRQYFCWVDGLQENGQINPSNPACQDAVDQAGTTHLYNWFANLDSNGQGRTEGYVPDGEICSGGNNGPYDFSPYSMARTDWPRTHLTAGDTYEFRHNNWARHPGRFDVYLTTQGYNPNAPLSWDDLELIDTAQDPPDSGGPGGENYYFWDTTFPSNRSGLHMLFIHWVRSDSPENFYSCSDVIFDGGNGEVSGLDGDPGEPPETDPPDPNEPPTTPGPPIVSDVTSTGASLSWGASDGFVSAYEIVNVAGGGEELIAEIAGEPPATSTAVADLTPETSYELAVRARNDNTGDVSGLSDAAPFTTPAQDPEPEPGDCTVSYEVTNDWGAGFQAAVTVTNDSGSTVNGWGLDWTFPSGQEITQAWNGVADPTGPEVTVSNASWNLNIPADGGSVSFGFLGSPGGGDDPATFLLNGEACATS